MKKECRICKGTEFKEVIDFGKTPLVNSLLSKEECGTEESYPLIVEQCQKCFLVQIVNPISSSKIYQEQDYLYYTGDMPQNSQYMKAFDSLVASIQDFSKSGDFVVEIGSNDGTILKKVLDRKVLGVDPAINVVIRALARGVPTLSAPFSKHNAEIIAHEFGKAHVVGGANCLAHIDDVLGVLDGMHTLLADEGVFWAECNYWGGMVKNKHYALIYHDHYSYYTLKNWVDLLTTYNMEVFDALITQAQGEGLSLRLFACRKGKRNPTERFLALLKEEETTHLNSYETAQKYRTDVLAEAQKLGDLVRGLAKDGKVIAGYGAAAKGFSILHLARITQNEIKFFVDDSPAKQGKYTPITHIPVLARADVQKLPDYFFITAPNYEDVIIAKEQDFLKAGGKFITADGRIVGT